MNKDEYHSISDNFLLHLPLLVPSSLDTLPRWEESWPEGGLVGECSQPEPWLREVGDDRESGVVESISITHCRAVHVPF